MERKPTYEELEQRVKELEKESLKHRKAKDALRESEERYKHLVDYANDIIYRTDANGNFTFCNPISLKISSPSLINCTFWPNHISFSFLVIVGNS